ncbi:LysR substrate-binding domain-containing protein [Sinorhizobium meliloti]|uniref:LysR substrate-binding domain-containing protein n=1 Tax=Rhizobium meliloti TaxID=382 RepID=UPI003F5CDDC7
MIDWILDAELQRRARIRLNKGEAHHVLMTLEELREVPFVLFPRRPRPSYADYVHEVCKRNGFIPASQVMVQDFLTAISFVSVGVGVCVSCPSRLPSTSGPGSATETFEGFNPRTKLSLDYRRDNRSPHLFRFLALARKVAQNVSRAI